MQPLNNPDAIAFGWVQMQPEPKKAYTKTEMSVLARVESSDVPLPRFRPGVFIAATFAAAALLVSIVAIPQWLSKQARWEVLRSHVGQIGQLAASAVDGDAHRQLLEPANYSDKLYARALKPLVRFHSANSDLFYVYSMFDRVASHTSFSIPLRHTTCAQITSCVRRPTWSSLSCVGNMKTTG